MILGIFACFWTSMSKKKDIAIEVINKIYRDISNTQL